MKLLRLELMAFGPFSGVDLDFAGEGLHLVYGKNEAGKSTALRAITGLLYGIPRNTDDAHLHKMPDLRIGGVIGAGAEVLSVVRRKGKDNTLLDRGGRPVEEAILAGMLGGISEAQFLTMFGLDHITLRSGGEALLLGKGNAGESLFGAAMAGGELHQVLRSLRAEADGIFSAKAHSKPLNEALRAFAEAQRKTRERSTSPESVVLQMGALDELARERETCEAERQRLRVERARLEHLRRVLPLKTRRRALAERRRALGEVVRLAPDSATARIEEQRSLAAARAEAERIEQDLGELGQRRERVAGPESAVPGGEMPADLAERLGGHRKAARDLPRVKAEIDELDAQVRAILRKIGRDPGDKEIQRIDAPTQARIRELALDDAGLAQARSETGAALAQKQARLAARSDARKRLPPSHDVAALKSAAHRAGREGPIEQRLAETTARIAQLEASAGAQLSSLGLGAVPLARAAGLPLPAGETLDRSALRLAELEREEEVAAAEASGVAARLDQIVQSIEALERAGRVPTEADLLSARAARNQTLRSLLERVDMPAASRTAAHQRTVARYQEEVREADEISDRLRREAERVSRLAGLLSERDLLAQQRTLLGERARMIAGERAAEVKAYRDLFRAAGVTPDAPPEMRSWLTRHAALARTFEQIEVLRAEAAGLAASIERHCDALHALLVAGGSAPSLSTRLEPLLDRAAATISAAEATAVERAQLEREVADLEAETDRLKAAAAAQQQRQDTLDAAWRSAVAPLGLGEHPSAAQVTIVLDLLADAMHKMDEAESARRRAAAIEAESSAFAREVSELARRHAPDLTGAPFEQAAVEMSERAIRMQTAAAERRELDRQIEQAGERLARQRKREQAALAALAALMGEAGVDSIESLERAEQRSDEARRLDAQMAELDSELDALGDQPEDTQPEGASAELLAARLEELETEVELLDQQARAQHQRFGGIEAGLKQLGRSDASAAEAAAEAQSALARVRDLTERYAVSRVAALVLATEIERYRLLYQGPVLARASELFRRLTLGSFTALRTDYNDADEAVLRGVRADDRELGVEGMSEGTRDQLFLALRLATLERHAETHTPLPIVLDDVLIHFDDDRARAALAALGDLSLRTQVLFFTHHARLVELAEEAIPRSQLHVHDLLGARAGREVETSPLAGGMIRAP